MLFSRGKPILPVWLGENSYVQPAMNHSAMDSNADVLPPGENVVVEVSQNEIVRFALNNRWLEEQGVPDMRAIWMVLHYGPDARV